MYENLLCLPYFQGMSKDDITAILDKVKLEFITYNSNDTVREKGEECRQFLILTKGTLSSITYASDNSYSIEEEHKAPYALEPYSMFGYNTTYKRKYIAKDNCTTLVIEKNYFFSEFSKQNIFMLNFLNLISRKVQFQNKGIWDYTPKTIEGRIVSFIALRCESTSGYKKIHIKMERLGEILCETRLKVSRALNNLQEKGLITLSRKEIHIPEFEKLLHLIND